MKPKDFIMQISLVKRNPNFLHYDELPAKEMNASSKHCRMADVVLCLGTSLQITPACNLPLKSLRRGGKIVIVNLQPTPKDKKACLVIHGFVDKVIAGIMHLLDRQIPPYVRIDLFHVIFNQFLCVEERKYAKWSVKLVSVHGEKAPLPFIKSVEVSFPERRDLKVVELLKQPFLLKREILKSKVLKRILLKINFTDGCGCQFVSIDFPVNFQEFTNFVSLSKDIVVQNLKDLAVQDKCCGQFSIIERKILSGQRNEISTYAVVTNTVRYDGLAHTAKSNEVSRDEKLGETVNSKSDGFCIAGCEDEEAKKKLRVY